MRRPCRRRAAGAACDARSHWPSRARPAGDLKRLEWVRTALRRSRQTWCGRRDGAEWLQSAVPDTGVGFMAFTNVMQSAPSALSRRALVARSSRASQPPQPATDGSGAAGIKKGTRSAYGPGLTRPAGTCPGLRRWPTASAGSQREMHTTRSALSVRAYRLTRAKNAASDGGTARGDTSSTHAPATAVRNSRPQEPARKRVCLDQHSP
jgi:hypothetical protein